MSVSFPVSYPSVICRAPIETPDAAADTSLGRVIEWIRQDRPGYQQALVYTAVAITAIVLVGSVVGIAVLVKMVEEGSRLNRQAKTLAGDKRVLDSVGGLQLYEQLPTLKLRDAALNVNVEVNPHHMNHSMMRGIDKYDRPFLAIRVLDRTDQQQFVQLLYRKYTYQEMWEYTRGAKTIFTGYCVDQESIKTLSQITQGTHPRYRLV
ncbi:MAG: hypothetical protein KGZ39_01205 [Simkania sp.]|nr:hypothetical protein [Simkania sp.]